MLGLAITAGAWTGAGEGPVGSATSKSPQPSSSSSITIAGFAGVVGARGADTLPHGVVLIGWDWNAGHCCVACAGCATTGEAWLAVLKKSKGSLGAACGGGCDCK